MKQITTSEVLNPSISRTRAPPHSGWNVSGSTALGFRRILLLGIPRRNRSSRSGSETTTTNEALERETSSRSEEHTSELRHGYISYAVFCLKKKKKKKDKATLVLRRLHKRPVVRDSLFADPHVRDINIEPSDRLT